MPNPVILLAGNLLQPMGKYGRGQKIGAPPRAKVSDDKFPMKGYGLLPPTVTMNPSGVEKRAGGCLGKFESFCSATV